MTTVDTAAKPASRAARLASAARRLPAASVLAVASATLTVAFLLYLGFTRVTPVFFGDEIGYLANAIALGGGPTISIDAGSYYPGWSLVLVPVWWLTRDPLGLYRGAVILSAVSQIATIPVLAALGRRFGLDGRAAVIAACAVVALPAHSLMAGFGLAESFLGLVVAATVACGVAAVQSGGWRRYAATGALAGFAFVVHGRTVPLVAVTLAWALLLVIAGWRPRDALRRRAGLAMGAAGVLAAGVGYLIYHHLEETLYESSERESTGIARLLGSDPGATALGASGQAWYAVVATAGLVLLGLWLLGAMVRDDWRARRIGWATWVAAACLSLFAISITYVSDAVGSAERLDLFVYGRYSQPVTDLLTFFGLVQLTRLTRRHWRRSGVILLSAFAVAAGGYALLASVAVPMASDTRSGWNAMNILGLAAYTWRRDGETTLPVLQAALIGGMALVALLVARRIRHDPAWALGLGVALALGSAITGQARTVVPAYAGFTGAFTLAAGVEARPGETVAFDTAPSPLKPLASSVVSRNAYAYFLAPDDLEVVDSSEAMPDTDLVIARRYWPAGSETGWSMIGADARYDNALWLRPGAPAAPSAPQ